LKARTMLLGLLCGLWYWCGAGMTAGEESAGPGAASSGSPWKTWAFDFESIRWKNQPAGWERVTTKKGGPDYDRGLVVYSDEEDGSIFPPVTARKAADAPVETKGAENHCLRLVLQVGKISYQTSSCPGAGKGEQFMPASGAKSYRLKARIQTEGFEQLFRPTGAYVSILWFEKAESGAICRYSDGTPIIFNTAPITRDTGGRWQDVELTVDTVPPGARFLRLRCTVEGKGIRSVAMFDDVVLSEGPRVALDAGRLAPLFAEGEPIEIAVTVDGLERGAYSEVVTTEDLFDHKVISTDTRQFRSGGREANDTKLESPYLVRMSSFGAFRISYRLKDSEGRDVAVRSMVIARVPKAGPLQYADKYGVHFNFLERPYPLVGNFIHALGVGLMKCELWGEGITRETDQADLLRFAAEMRRMGVRSVGILGSSPIALTKAMGLSAPLEGKGLFGQPAGERREALWAYLREDLAPWADLLDGVQLAPEGNSSFGGPVGEIGASFAEEMMRPLASARCAFPATAGEAPPEGAEVIALTAPASMSPDDLARKLGEMKTASLLWVTLEMRPEGRARISDMVKKTAVCLAAGVDKIFLPLDSRGAGLIRIVEFPNESAELTPAFAAFRFITQALDGASFVEKFDVGTMRMCLFEKGGGSLALIWSDEGETTAPVFWGDGLKMYDHFGNALAMRSAGGETLIEGLGAMPRVVTGMNADMMRTWRLLQLATKSIEASLREQTVVLTMENRFDKNIECTMRLEFEEGLRHLQPRGATAKFSLGPGESWSSGETFSLKPSISDGAGVKTFSAVVTVNSEAGQFTIKKTFGIDLAASSLGLRVVRIAREESGGIVVRVAVKNGGAERAGANVYASADGGGTKEWHVSLPRLEAGAETEVEFRMKFGGEGAPERIWLGLREINGRRFMNLNLGRREIEAALNAP